MQRERGFVFGAAEDGTVYCKEKKCEYILEIEQLDKRWLLEVQKALEKGFGLKSSIRQRKTRKYYRLVVYSKDLYNELLEMRKDFGKILSAPLQFQKGFVQGLFDAEGSVSKRRYSLRAYNKKHKLLHVAKTVLERAGVKPAYLLRDKRGIWVLHVYGTKNLRKFRQSFGFHHPEKQIILLEKLKTASVQATS